MVSESDTVSSKKTLEHIRSRSYFATAVLSAEPLSFIERFCALGETTQVDLGSDQGDLLLYHCRYVSPVKHYRYSDDEIDFVTNVAGVPHYTYELWCLDASDLYGEPCCVLFSPYVRLSRDVFSLLNGGLPPKDSYLSLNIRKLHNKLHAKYEADQHGEVPKDIFDPKGLLSIKRVEVTVHGESGKLGSMSFGGWSVMSSGVYLQIAEKIRARKTKYLIDRIRMRFEGSRSMTIGVDRFGNFVCSRGVECVNFVNFVNFLTYSRKIDVVKVEDTCPVVMGQEE